MATLFTSRSLMAHVSVPHGSTLNTQSIQSNDYWTVAKAWIYPEALWGSFSTMSTSDDSFGPDGWIYITGHDTAGIHALKIPSVSKCNDLAIEYLKLQAGDILIWAATTQAPNIAGQVTV